MKKAIVIVLTMALLTMFSASSLNSASAMTTYVDYEDAFGETVIDIAGHAKIVIDGYHFDSSSSLGAGNVIRILYYVGKIGGIDRYLPVAIFTDIPQRATFLQQFYAIYPTSIQLVDSLDIEARREGKSLTMMIVWKTALVVPEETWLLGKTPAFTVPSGRLIFRGHGDAMEGSSSGTGAAGWSQTVTYTFYYGNATFVCPTWDFGGPVGENSGTYRTNVRLDAIVTSTKP